MFRKSWLIPAVLLLAGVSVVTPAHAQDAACPYTLASLKGTYSLIINYEGGVALSLQTETFDGKGNLTRSGIINQPTVGSTTGARTIGTVSSVGTYTVNCNGTGTFVKLVTKPDGTTAPAVDDFIISEATSVVGRPLVAFKITDAQRDPSVILPGGVFVTRVHTRLPDVNPYGVVLPPA